MEMHEDRDWEWVGASYYEKCISELTAMIQHDQEETGNLDSAWHRAGRSQDSEHNETQIRNTTTSLRSDEVVAATAILCVYEFLSATAAAWSRHLNGTKSLLEIAEGSIVPLEVPRSDLPYLLRHRQASNARKAIFWIFARQDYLSACMYTQFRKIYDHLAQSITPRKQKRPCEMTECRYHRLRIMTDRLQSSMRPKLDLIRIISNYGGKQVSFISQMSAPSIKSSLNCELSTRNHMILRLVVCRGVSMELSKHCLESSWLAQAMLT